MLPKKNNPDSSSDCPVSNKFNSILTNNPVARLDEPFRGFKMVVARVLYQQLGGTIFYFYIFLKVVLRFFFLTFHIFPFRFGGKYAVCCYLNSRAISQTFDSQPLSGLDC